MAVQIPPQLYTFTGVSPPTPPKPHLWADLVELIGSNSPRARLFVHLTLLQQLAELVRSTRKQQPAVSKALSAALLDGADKFSKAIMGADFYRGK